MADEDIAVLAHAPTEHHHRHPTPKQYWVIGAILAVLTAIEVGLSYLNAASEIIIPALFAFGALKFAIVAGWFMHLRFDVRIYSRFFMMGIFGTIILFVVVLATFQAL